MNLAKSEPVAVPANSIVVYAAAVEGWKVREIVGNNPPMRRYRVGRDGEGYAAYSDKDDAIKACDAAAAECAEVARRLAWFA